MEKAIRMKANISDNKLERTSKPAHKQKINNPGIDRAIWERLKNKWSELDKNSHKLTVEFKLIGDPKDDRNILAIDVTQNIDGEVITETVQRKAGEAYTTLGIAGLSRERLEEVYKEMMDQLHRQTGQKKDVDLIVTMSPSSPLSGEIRGYTEKRDSGEKSSVSVNYQHYYILNALREKMIESTGDGWSQVKAVYRSGDLEFYFEY
jgi:hypothetical protein